MFGVKIAMKKKDAILQVATSLFAIKGYKDTAMGELTKATGVAEGTIFYHFKSKQGLFIAILSNLKDGILPEFECYRNSKSDNTGLAMVEETISFYLYLSKKKAEIFALLHQRYPFELANNSPECRGILESIYNGFVDLFESAIIIGQQDGSIDPNINGRKYALIVFAMADSIVRFRMNNLYDTGSLFNDLIESCRRMLENRKL